MTKTLTQILAAAALAAVLAGCASSSTGTPAAATQPAATPTAGVSGARCTVVSQSPTASPTDTSQFPPVTDADWIRGPASAKVTFTEYGDFM
jgi:ABC-type uncharacterized transport system auxiliary subunit